MSDLSPVRTGRSWTPSPKVASTSNVRNNSHKFLNHVWSVANTMMMQSISSNNDSTYTSYMFSCTAGMLTLPRQPCLGPRQLKFGDY
jgi:hypothetical protein